MRTLNVWLELPDDLVNEVSAFGAPDTHAQLTEHNAGEWTAVTHTKGDVDCVFRFDTTAELLAFVARHECRWNTCDDEGLQVVPDDQSAAALLAALD